MSELKRCAIRFLNHVRRQAIAYLALFVALGGTGWALSSLPPGSVTAASLNRHSIGGYVLAWAHVSAAGRVVSGSPGATVQPRYAGQATPAFYLVRWRGVKLSKRCIPLAGASGIGSAGSGVTKVFATIEKPGEGVPTDVLVVEQNASGAQVANGFYLAVIC